MKFDKVFKEKFQHFGLSEVHEEDDSVNVKLTREEAAAIHQFLQGEGFEHDAWGGVRTQLNELGPALAVGARAVATQAPKAAAGAPGAAGAGVRAGGSQNLKRGAAGGAAVSAVDGDNPPEGSENADDGKALQGPQPVF